jgi:hypothetical protein
MNKVNKFAAALIIWLIASLKCFGDLPEDQTEYAAWEVNFFNAIEKQRSIAPEASIPKLADYVLRLSRGTNIEKGERPVFHAARNLLLSIPGHATYFQNKLESLRAKTLELAKLPEDQDPYKMKVGQAFGDYDMYQKSTVFPTLALLPSSETVAVLGHFLNDPEGRDGRDLLGNRFQRSDVELAPINAGAAAIALRRLGIEHPPFRGFRDHDHRNFNYTPEEIDAWKDWWNEVKDGKRTYRFIGSPIEYGPDGPASKEQLQRIERNRQREASSKAPRSAATSPEVEEPSEKPSSKIGIAIGGAVLVLLASIIYVLRAKKQPSH